MKLFICWSGDRSFYVAKALHTWIPGVINDVDPWCSEEDIAKGAHWPLELMNQLEESKFGIVCLTPENVANPWVLFEAGALWKAFGQTRVCPYLLELEKSDVRAPLGHFQSSKTDKEDTRKLVRSINDAVKEEKGKFRTEEQLSEAFDTWWPKLEGHLVKVPRADGSEKAARKDSEVLSEILDTTRSVQRELSKISAGVNAPHVFWSSSGPGYITTMPGLARSTLIPGSVSVSLDPGEEKWQKIQEAFNALVEAESGKDKDRGKKEEKEK